MQDPGPHYHHDPVPLRLRLLWDGLLVGCIGGGASILYRYMIENITELQHYLYTVRGAGVAAVLLLFGVLGYIMAKLLAWAPLSGGSGIPQIRGELMHRVEMEEGPTIVSKFLGGGMGALAGLSLGREGPSIQIGGATGKFLARKLHRDPMRRNYMITAGASAGLSAAFNAPIAGALFAMEEMHKSFSHYLMIPCLAASIVANYISYNIMGFSPAFSFSVTYDLPLKALPLVLAMGLATGAVGVLFNAGLIKALEAFDRLKMKKTTVMALLLVLTYPLGRLFPEVLGGGHHFVEHMMMDTTIIPALFALLFVKMAFTWVSYGSGAQGGIFLPTLVLGAIIGYSSYLLFSRTFGLENMAINFVILGMVGILTAVVRAPFLSIVLVTEMTGSFHHLIFTAIIAYVSFFVAEGLGNNPIYDSLYERLVKKTPKPTMKKSNHLFSSEYTMDSGSPLVGISLKDLNFPCHLYIYAITREGRSFMPGADDSLLPGDEVTVIHDVSDSEKIETYFMEEFPDN